MPTIRPARRLTRRAAALATTFGSTVLAASAATTAPALAAGNAPNPTYVQPPGTAGLTTILGYSERLERAEAAVRGGRGQALAVRQASLHLARLIEKA